MNRPPGKFEHLRIPLLLAAILAGSFMAGGTAIYYKLPPYELIDNTVSAMKAEELQDAIIQHNEKYFRFVPCTKENVPVIHKRDAYEGYTLYTTSGSPGPTTLATLIDMNGHTVHEWSLPYSKFPGKVKLNKRLPDELMYWFDAYLYPNGDLLGVYQGLGTTPYGAGLVKLDKDSHVIWSYSDYTTHAVDVREDGSIIVLVQAVTPPPSYKDIPFANKSIINEWIAFLTPEGKEIKRISLIDALAKSDYKGFLQKHVRKELNKGDVLHPNSLMTLSTEMAKYFPMFKPGQILISLHNLGSIGVIDPDTGKFVWLTANIWRGQHHAQFSKDGTITLFDNLGSHQHQSRILKYNPATDATQIVYEGTEKHPFFSTFVGMQQELPNGNMMITEEKFGRIFEINRKKEIVWQFIDPYRRKKPLRITVGRRYGPKELTFLADTATGKRP